MEPRFVVETESYMSVYSQAYKTGEFPQIQIKKEDRKNVFIGSFLTLILNFFLLMLLPLEFGAHPIFFCLWILFDLFVFISFITALGYRTFIYKAAIAGERMRIRKQKKVNEKLFYRLVFYDEYIEDCFRDIRIDYQQIESVKFGEKIIYLNLKNTMRMAGHYKVGISYLIIPVLNFSVGNVVDFAEFMYDKVL